MYTITKLFNNIFSKFNFLFAQSLYSISGDAKAPEGRYSINAEAHSYRTLSKYILYSQDQHIKVLIVTPDKRQEIVVTSQKTSIERKFDKTVLNISSNKFLEGKDILQDL